MTLEEGAAAFEKEFDLVVTDRGFQGEMPAHARDFARAPNGDAYVWVTSCGILKPGDLAEAYFTDEEAAIDAWLDVAQDYGRRREGTTLYWDQRPVYEAADFIAVQQSDLASSLMLRGALAMRLGLVVSRLVVNRSDKRSPSAPKQEG